jgi:hypothetical protein
VAAAAGAFSAGAVPSPEQATPAAHVASRKSTLAARRADVIFISDTSI